MKMRQLNPYSSILEKDAYLIKDNSKTGKGKHSKLIDQILNDVPNKNELFQNSKVHSSTPSNINRKPKSGIRVSYIYSVIQDLENNEKDISNLIDLKHKLRTKPKSKTHHNEIRVPSDCASSDEKKERDQQQITSNEHKKTESKDNEENFWNDEDKLGLLNQIDISVLTKTKTIDEPKKEKDKHIWKEALNEEYTQTISKRNDMAVRANQAREHCFLLYERGKIKNEVLKLIKLKNKELEAKQDLLLCTFKPKLNKNLNRITSGQEILYDSIVFKKPKVQRKSKKAMTKRSSSPKSQADLSKVFNPNFSIANDEANQSFIKRLDYSRNKKAVLEAFLTPRVYADNSFTMNNFNKSHNLSYEINSSHANIELNTKSNHISSQTDFYNAAKQSLRLQLQNTLL